MMHQTLAEKLTGATYQADQCSVWSKEIADDIKNKIKEMSLPRYKFIVNVVIGEMRGEGVR
jgi:tctex1 domain-containing protein 2